MKERESEKDRDAHNQKAIEADRKLYTYRVTLTSISHCGDSNPYQPIIKLNAIPRYPMKVPIAVAVVRWWTGNQRAERSAQELYVIMDAVPANTWDILFNLKKQNKNKIKTCQKN